MNIERAFQSGTPERQRFLADLFGLFSAEIVRCWAADSHSPYVALDNPVLRKKSASRGSSLDFAFVYRKNVYAVTLCCDPLRHGTLSEAEQVAAEDNTKAFGEFLDAAHNPGQYIVLSGGEEYPAAGSILVWHRVEDRRTLHSALRKQYDFQALLSLETIISELASWHNRDFQLLLDQRFAWCHDLFKALRNIR